MGGFCSPIPINPPNFRNCLSQQGNNPGVEVWERGVLPPILGLS